MRALKAVLIVLLIALAAGAAFVLTRTPSNDRAWKDYLATPAHPAISSDGAHVSFEHVRDFTYDENGPVTKAYVAREYDVSTLTGMRLVMEPFPWNEAFGHTLLVFEFSDAEPVVISVEARIEEGEDYSAFAGLWNEFELAYTWGTERDFLARRAVLLRHQVESYPLALPTSIAQEAFVALAKATADLEAHPRFYNTLAHNCTNELARIVNEMTPNRLPWDWSRVFTGFADRYLYRLGLIEGDSFDSAKAAADVTDRVRAISSAPDFSSLLRANK